MNSVAYAIPYGRVKSQNSRIHTTIRDIFSSLVPQHRYINVSLPHGICQSCPIVRRLLINPSTTGQKLETSKYNCLVTDGPFSIDFNQSA